MNYLDVCCLNSETAYSSESPHEEYEKPQFIEDLFRKRELSKIEPADLQEELEGFLYLPGGRYVTARLIYLTKIKENNDLCALTCRQDKVFRMSTLTDQRATNCLKCGCGLLLCASVVSCPTAGPTYFTGKWILETVSLTLSIASNLTSYISTGCYPHIASEKANDKQNLFNEAKGVYEELGVRLIELMEHDKELAFKIAENLDFPAICKSMERALCKEEIEILLEPLEKAIKFVRDKEFPSTPSIIGFAVQTLLLRKEMRVVKDRLLKLENGSPILLDEDSLKKES